MTYWKCRIALLVFTLLFLTVPFAVGQEEMRIVEQFRYIDAPLEIGLELKNKEFIDTTRVMAGRDWLRELRLRIRNSSTKDIRAFDIALLVEKRGDMATAVSFPVLFRNYSKATPENARTQNGEAKLGPLEPGEVIKVGVSDQHLKIFGDILKKYGAEDVRAVRLYIQFVYFEDGTEWAFGKTPAPKEQPGRTGSGLLY
ncbi:MAG: hypothetical protein WBO10_13675 [Pyrinomonadaceae bacterium]